MLIGKSLAARQRFYEILGSASIAGPLAAKVHVGLVSQLKASRQVDLDLHRAHRLVSDPRSAYYVADIRDRKAEAIRLFDDGDALKGSWMPDHLHFNYLRRRAPPELATQLDVASAIAKAGVPVLTGLFSGYAHLPLDRGQWLELLDLTCEFDPKLQLEMRAFREPFRIVVATATGRPQLLPA